MLSTILFVVLILALLGVLPRWSHSRSWGYRPSGAVGLLLVILLVLFLMGRILGAGHELTLLGLVLSTRGSAT